MSPALLEEVLGTKAKVRILRVLCRDPARRYSGNALARKAGMSPNTVHRALDDLAAAGVVDILERPGSHDVQLSEEMALSDDLRALFDGEDAVGDRILEALRTGISETEPEGEVTVVLFGSLAEGTAGPTSDIDLLIVAPSYDRAADVALVARDAVRGIVPLPVRTVSFTPPDLRRDWDEPFVRSARDHGRLVTGPGLEAYT